MPRHFYLDASALAKRYAPEPGTPVINYFFSRAPGHRIFVLRLGVAEVVSILVRKRNANILSPSITTQAFTDLEAEIIDQPSLPKGAKKINFPDSVERRISTASGSERGSQGKPRSLPLAVLIREVNFLRALSSMPMPI